MSEKNLEFKEVRKLYYEKFGEYISLPMPYHFTDKELQRYLQEHMDCIQKNIKFDSEKFFNEEFDDVNIY